MPSNKFTLNGNEYEYSLGRYYKNGNYVNEAAFKRAWSRYYGQSFEGGKKKSTKTVFRLSDHYKRQLWGKSEWAKNPWNSASNRIRSEFKPLTIDGKNPYFGRTNYSPTSRTNAHWGATISKKDGSRNCAVFNNIEDCLRHIEIAKYQIGVQAEHFRVVVGQRALRIFQLSFEKHKFVNEDRPWQNLATYTMNKRRKAGTWHGVQKSKLYEYGNLSRSIKLNNTGKKTRIKTIPITSTRNKNGNAKAFSYAGIHNNGVPKGRKPGRAIPRRQFMGWTTPRRMDKVDRFAYEIADRYLFDSVFLSKKS